MKSVKLIATDVLAAAICAKALRREAELMLVSPAVPFDAETRQEMANMILETARQIEGAQE